jgi:hypothetical protein
MTMGGIFSPVSFRMISSDFPLTGWNLILINKNNVINYQD